MLKIHTLSGINVDSTVACLAAASSPIVLVVDDFATHVQQVMEVLQNPETMGKVVVLAAERRYRKDYLHLIIGEEPHILMPLLPLSREERLQLVELFRSYGLTGAGNAVQAPVVFADGLEGDSVAIAVCRILNDYRPLDRIVDSLWDATPTNFRLPYLCTALSMHCHSAGIRYSVLQAVAGTHVPLSGLFSDMVPLGLAENRDDDEYVVPLNAVYAERVLTRAVRESQDLLFEAFATTAIALAPYVNREAIRKRTPEARLSGRLLDADKIVKPMLGVRAEAMYERCKSACGWNSRYWEQRALLVADSDLTTALQYARHAVANDPNPFALTTLGKLLFRQMTQLGAAAQKRVFADAFSILGRAIEIEGYRSRITVHPFATLLNGTARYIEAGSNLTTIERRTLDEHMNNADYYFGRDPVIRDCLAHLDELL